LEIRKIVRFIAETKVLFFSTMFRGPPVSPTLWVAGPLPAVVKWPGSETDYSPSSNAKVKNEWGSTFILPYAIIAYSGGRFTSST